MSKQLERDLEIFDIVRSYCEFDSRDNAAAMLKAHGVTEPEFVATMAKCPSMPSHIVLGIRNMLSRYDKGLNVLVPVFDGKACRRQIIKQERQCQN